MLRLAQWELDPGQGRKAAEDEGFLLAGICRTYLDLAKRGAILDLRGLELQGEHEELATLSDCEFLRCLPGGAVRELRGESDRVLLPDHELGRLVGCSDRLAATSSG